jgi:hypothetical protein
LCVAVRQVMGTALREVAPPPAVDVPHLEAALAAAAAAYCRDPSHPADSAQPAAKRQRQSGGGKGEGELSLADTGGYRGERCAVGLGYRFTAYKRTLPPAPSRGCGSVLMLMKFKHVFY